MEGSGAKDRTAWRDAPLAWWSNEMERPHVSIFLLAVWLADGNVRQGDLVTRRRWRKVDVGRRERFVGRWLGL